MDNRHLFELINASPGLSSWRLAMGVVLAEGVIYLVPIALAVAWMRGDTSARQELFRMVLTATIALLLAQAVGMLWPQPRPAALHLGTQYLAHADDPGLPSDHVTVFWSLALSALSTRRFAVWTFPLLAAGLVVGLSRVYLGLHFPFDVLAALPVAALAAALGLALRRWSNAVALHVVALYERATGRARARPR